jgi:ABC-type Fe3+/spermidine/putrescine transport system ATPase subunit
LLDEPFSHIDHFRKNNLRRKLFAYLKENKITCIIATHDSTDALSFADETFVLKNGKIFANDSPRNLYENPPNKYVASLFGDVNELILSSLLPEKKSRKKILLYPHEIKLEKASNLRVKVLASYFKGGNYLIKSMLKSQIVYFDHASELKVGENIGIVIEQKLIESRIRNR